MTTQQRVLKIICHERSIFNFTNDFSCNFPHGSNSMFVSHSSTSNYLWPNGLLPPRLLCLWNSPGKNIRVGCHSLLHRIFLTQGSNWIFCIAGRFFTIWATGKPSNSIQGAKFVYIRNVIKRKQAKMTQLWIQFSLCKADW